jgi:hypothetical protein
MFPGLRYFRSAALLTCLVCLTYGGRATAGWMGFRNDTSTTLIIQETVPAGGGTRPGKPQKIFANETVRETPPAGGQRAFTIADAAKPDKPLFNGKLASPPANENVLYVIKSDGKGGLTVEAVSSPAAVTKHPPKR